MAYGKPSKNNRPYSKGKKLVEPVKTTTSNKPVQVALETYKKPPIPVANSKLAVSNNHSAILALARQVKNLQVNQIGFAQKKIDQWSYSSNGFTNMTPFCLCLQQLFTSAKVYQCNSATGAITGTPFTLQDNQYSAGMKQFDQWRNANDDSVSLEVFRPTCVELLIELEISMAASDETQRVRFDVVRPNKVVVKSSGDAGHDLTLPDGLASFQRIADERITTQQAINPTYFTKKQTKWVKVSNNTSPSTSKVVRRIIKIKHFFDKRPIKCDVDTASGETFLTNVDPRKLDWLIMSNSENESNIKIDIRRTSYYRDPHGVAA